LDEWEHVFHESVLDSVGFLVHSGVLGPVKVCLVDVTVAISNGGHETVVGVLEHFKERNELGSDLCQQLLEGVVQQVSSLTDEVSAGISQGRVLLKVHDSKKGNKVGHVASQVCIWDSLDLLVTDRDDEALDVDKSHLDDVLGEDGVDLFLLRSRVLVELLHSLFDVDHRNGLEVFQNV
jgi:hypothetical protein